MIKPEAEYLFEVSFEVCNKVGGIHAVVASKSKEIMKYCKNYFAIGPYYEDKAKEALVEQEAPLFLKKAFEQMHSIGLKCHYGKWIDAENDPPAILVEFFQLMGKKNEIKTSLWNDFKIDSYTAGYDFDEPVVWSTAVGMLIDLIGRELKGKKIVAHFHEWLCGAGLLYLKKNSPKIKTVFTTHATMLGRALSGRGYPLYEHLSHLDTYKEAYNLGIQAKFLIEKASAQNADIFTTVSEITSVEASKILERKPEVLVLNGIDMSKFPTIEETSIKHLTCREKIREFLTFYFFPHYDFSLEHNLIFFLSGRNEFRNKGVDVYIKALGRLNEQLKKDKTKRTISAFIWVPLGHRGIKTEIIENKSYYQHIKNFVGWNSKEILKSITYDLILEKDLSKDTIFTQKFLKEARKNIIHFKRQGNPPLCTHYIDNEESNEIIQELKKNGLQNRQEDSVKTILYPVYLAGDDGLINLPYMDALAGTHLGIYPSYYEPWGYTPLENAGMGVASITTDLAGFGRFIKDKTDEKDPGIWVLPRHHKPDEDVIQKLFELMYMYAKFSHEERVKNKLNAKNAAESADWKILIKNYIEAYNLALKK